MYLVQLSVNFPAFWTCCQWNQLYSQPDKSVIWLNMTRLYNTSNTRPNNINNPHAKHTPYPDLFREDHKVYVYFMYFLVFLGYKLYKFPVSKKNCSVLSFSPGLHLVEQRSWTWVRHDWSQPLPVAPPEFSLSTAQFVVVVYGNPTTSGVWFTWKCGASGKRRFRTWKPWISAVLDVCCLMFSVYLLWVPACYVIGAPYMLSLFGFGRCFARTHCP